MRIGMIGAGHIGSSLAGSFANAGHEVALSNSRGPETLRDLSEELGETVQAMTADAAARWAEVAVEAIPFGRYRDLPREALDGKILISASNYDPERDGEIDVGGRAVAEGRRAIVE